MIYRYVIVDDIYLRMLGQLCACAENTLPAVGVANKNTLFVMLVGRVKGIEAY